MYICQDCLVHLGDIGGLLLKFLENYYVNNFSIAILHPGSYNIHIVIEFQMRINFLNFDINFIEFLFVSKTKQNAQKS